MTSHPLACRPARRRPARCRAALSTLLVATCCVLASEGCAPLEDLISGDGDIVATINGAETRLLSVKVQDTTVVGVVPPTLTAALGFSMKSRLGTFTCGGQGEGLGVLILTTGLDTWAGILPGGACTVTYSKVATKAGERWEGTFSGTLVHASQQTRFEISNGRFSIPRQ